jgi:carbonic anhydrase
MSAIDELLERNARYAENFSEGGLSAPPSMQVAIVACMDARLETGALLGLAEGEAHVVRNAGGAVTDDAIRSLVISQRLLGTREVMLVHHTDCGMASFRDDDLRRQIEQETGVRPPFAFESFADAEADVRQSIERLRASPFLPHKDGIRGFLYEVETGRLREVT